MVRDLRAWGAEVVVPVRGELALVAIMLLGPKLSGDPYFRDDLDLLETLASQLAIGLENAKLYHQVVSIKEYNERILAHMDSSVVAVRDDGMVTTFNQAAERSTGLRGHEIIGRSVGGLDPAIQNALKASLAGEQDTEAEIAISRPDGATLPLLIHTSALHDASGRIRGAIAVFSDHSRLKALEDDKRRTERLAAVGALASGIAHEIRNPLVAIKTFAELLPERADDPEFRSTFAKVASKEIHRIEELLGQLRALVTPTASSLTRLNVAVPIGETLDLLRGEAERRHVRLVADIPSGLPPVVGEASQLKQLFVNLVLNGLEAMASGGRLTVSLQATRGRPGRQLVTARVTDTGSGIQREELSRIFEPFFTTKAHGTGLGLAICRGIADAHRAALWAEPGPNGIGTAFVIQFPAVAESHVAETVG
jgi:PAS domain S-box-containing protein